MRNTVTFVGWIVSAMTIAAPSSEVLFRSDSYTVYSDSVRDDGPYNATSYSTDGISIYSPLPPPPCKDDPSACYVESGLRFDHPCVPESTLRWWAIRATTPFGRPK